MGASPTNGTSPRGRDARKTTRWLDGKENDARGRPFRRGIDEEDDFEEDLLDARGEDEDEDGVSASARAVGRRAKGVDRALGSGGERVRAHAGARARGDARGRFRER